MQRLLIRRREDLAKVSPQPKDYSNTVHGRYVYSPTEELKALNYKEELCEWKVYRYKGKELIVPFTLETQVA